MKNELESDFGPSLWKSMKKREKKIDKYVIELVRIMLYILIQTLVSQSFRIDGIIEIELNENIIVEFYLSLSKRSIANKLFQ